jgi:hypothetical protein
MNSSFVAGIIMRVLAALLASGLLFSASIIWRTEFSSSFTFNHSGRAMIAMVGFGLFCVFYAFRRGKNK